MRGSAGRSIEGDPATALEGSIEDRRGEIGVAQVFEDIFGWRGSRSPIMAVVADLSNERDPGLKKAVRRALRALAD